MLVAIGVPVTWTRALLTVAVQSQALLLLSASAHDVENTKVIMIVVPTADQPEKIEVKSFEYSR